MLGPLYLIEELRQALGERAAHKRLVHLWQAVADVHLCQVVADGRRWRPPLTTPGRVVHMTAHVQGAYRGLRGWRDLRVAHLAYIVGTSGIFHPNRNLIHF